MLHVVVGHRLEWLYHIAVTLSLRKGELLVLRWATVDLDAATLHIRAGKTEAATRTLPLLPVLVTRLRGHWALQQELRRIEGVRWREHGLVFPSAVGTPLSPRNLTRHYKGLLAAAELDTTLHFHDLRHTALTRLAEANTPPAVLKTIAGHKRFATTAEIYVHVAADQQQECIAKMSALYA